MAITLSAFTISLENNQPMSPVSPANAEKEDTAFPHADVPNCAKSDDRDADANARATVGKTNVRALRQIWSAFLKLAKTA